MQKLAVEDIGYLDINQNRNIFFVLETGSHGEFRNNFVIYLKPKLAFACTNPHK